jgi:hypothetical protein
VSTLYGREGGLLPLPLAVHRLDLDAELPVLRGLQLQPLLRQRELCLLALEALLRLLQPVHLPRDAACSISTG